LTAAAENVASALENAIVAGVRGEPREILDCLAAHQPDVVFNLCEAPLGRPALEPHVTALFEWTGIKFTGSGSETLALCRRKDRMNAVLQAHGVPVPRTGVFPAIVKPVDEDGSAHIDAAVICEDAAAVRAATARLASPALVQEFVDGREFAVSLWGQGAEHVSIGETLFRNGLRLITYAAKWEPESADFIDSPLDYRTDIDARLRAAIADTARNAWRAAGAAGYLRIDLRCNAEGTPLVLDVNPNPELGPEVGICRAVQEAGWSWRTFVRQQVEWARDR